MKFARTFNETLSSENFPQEWQAAAIPYRQLKKCIKRVQRELAELGLNVETLRVLISEQDVSCTSNDSAAKNGPILQYMFDGTMQSFQPKLVMTVYGRNGLHVDLGLSEETRRSLERLLRQRGIPGKMVEEIGGGKVLPVGGNTETSRADPESGMVLSPNSSDSEDQLDDLDVEPVSSVEIPLNHDTEFFRILTPQLSTLGRVQSRATKIIEGEIATIGSSVTAVAAPKSLASRSDLYPWREIFRIYLETGVFFSTLEMEAHKERTVEDAQERLDKFAKEVERLGLPKSFKNRSSHLLFQRLLTVNREVLRILRFQAINKMAMTKILKKFDKRTALGARQTYPTFVAENPFLASHLAKAICFTMSSKLLTIIPQLDDYLCPICQSISIKPVRLSCSHVFCVRCLVKLQRESKRFCPMCRDDVVLYADATNLDVSLLNFLRNYFPKEAKEKQKENEQEVMMEQWKAVHARAVSRNGGSSAVDACVLM